MKKKESIQLSKRAHPLNAHQFIESILWVDALVSGNYSKHPKTFTYADLGHNSYTTTLLAKIYPDAKFYHTQCISPEKNLYPLLNDRIAEKSINYLYLGETLSISSAPQLQSTFQFIRQKLSSEGYVIIPYEATVGWSEYTVILDLLKELELHSSTLTRTFCLKRIFQELNALAAKNIFAFKNKNYLTKLQNYLESLDFKHLQQLLKSPKLQTFYPYQVHEALNDGEAKFRFVGSLPILRNYVKLGLESAQKEFIGDPDNLMMASQRQDLILMPFHRIDIWQKIDATSQIPKGSIADFYLGCLATTEAFPPQVSKGYLTLNFSDSIYSELKKQLNQSFFTLDEIVQKTKHLSQTPQEIIDRLMSLVMTDQVRYCLQKPIKQTTSKPLPLKGGKLKFIHPENQSMFSNVGRFCKEVGVIIHPASAMIIPFDQQTSMIISALTKVHDSLVPQYCAEVFSKHVDENLDIAEATKEFYAATLFFKRRYLPRLLELGIIELDTST